ncbi:MAG: hypothetical protein ACK4RZ_14740 [Paracoccaceae bacterium]
MENDNFGGSGGTWQGSGGFGESGVSGQAGIGLARDVCANAARQQGLNLARINSAEQYSFGNGSPRGVLVPMQVRRDPMSVNVQPRVCRFTYADGKADISRT